MALIVTPGAPDADGFADFATVAAYAVKNGLAFTADEEEGSKSIRRGTTWLSTAWTWKGAKLNGRAQALAFPRSGVEDAEGEPVDALTIPDEIVRACCEASIYEDQNPGGLSPVVVMAQTVKRKRERVEGAVDEETEYFVGQQSVEASRPVLTKVRDIVSGLISTSGNPLAGAARRG